MEHSESLAGESAFQRILPQAQTEQPDVETNWSLCIFCQNEKSINKLTCPAESKQLDSGKGYITLENDLNNFTEIDALPKGISLQRLNNGSGIARTLSVNLARWHKNCRDKLNNTKFLRLQKRKSDELKEKANLDSFEPSKHTRSHYTGLIDLEKERECPKCFFCEQSGKEELTQAMTFGLDSNVRSAAIKLEHKKLLAKLSGGDVVALEMKYHLKCIASLYRRAEAVEKGKAELPEQVNNSNDSLAFAELVCFVEEELSNPDAPVLKLADIVKLYCARLQQLGIHIKVHFTRLKERLEAHIPGLKDYAKGRDVSLVRDKDLGKLLGDVFEKRNDSSAICLAQAAKIVRNDIFCDQSTLDMSFKPGCQETVYQLLLKL